MLLPESRTGYLAELASGSDVVVADVEGRSKSVIVGRAKVESRPLVSAMQLPGKQSQTLVKKHGCRCVFCRSAPCVDVITAYGAQSRGLRRESHT